MVFAPRRRRYRLTGTAKQQGLQKQNRHPFGQNHPHTQLWQPVSPFDECPSSVLAATKKHIRSQSTSAVDLQRHSHAAGKQSTAAVSNFASSARGRQLRSYGDAILNSTRKKKHLLGSDPSNAVTATPTRSDVGARLPVATALPRAPSKKILAHTSAKQTPNMWSPMMTSAHQVPTEIRIPGYLSPSGSSSSDGIECHAPDRSSASSHQATEDEHSEITLDQELRHKLSLSATENHSTASRTNSSSVKGRLDIDHPLFQKPGDLTVLYPQMSKFHQSITTHDSTWGITTATLEGEGEVDGSWPSDEDRTPTKAEKKPSRARSHTLESSIFTCDNPTTGETSPTPSATVPTMTTWEQLSCSAGLQLCSADGVRQSFFHPVFPGKKIPWRDLNKACRDDTGLGEDSPPSSCKRDTSFSSSKSSSSIVYEEFKLSRDRTITTETSSSNEKSVRFIL